MVDGMILCFVYAKSDLLNTHGLCVQVAFRKGIKMKSFLLFTIIFAKINVNVIKTIFASAIIC